ncbi:hypothetical protein Y919_06310 [Caloranaerobacter azorensis H53214]|uniref:Uncharacterized protein n=1 Tax=Caloranaerobacter azorensis H53214 TaxID=1156417 RepID=A0A096DMB2_9FIRM|nr:hypothetical protein [Caloranaerobacter azorensis]KGG80426.1 hypothetical protein Y919_06310 [Caloranaerobacter azorensis H53214]
MKKIIFILSIFSLILVFIVTYIQPKNNKIFVKSYTYMNIDAKGTKLSKKNAVESETKIKFDFLNKDQIILQGKIKYPDNTEDKFNIEGKIKKSKDNENIIFGDLVDKSNTFEIIDFRIDNDFKNSFLYSVDDYKNIEKSNIKKVIRLYLLNKKTRNFTMIEILNPNYTESQREFIDKLDIGKMDLKTKFWYSKLVKHTTGIKESKINEIKVAGIYPKYSSELHYHTYDFLGAHISEFIEVGYYYNYPAKTVGHGNVVTILKIEKKYTSCANYPEFSDPNNSSLVIGLGRDSIIQLQTDEGEYIRDLTLAKQAKESNNELQTKIGWASGNPKTGINVPLDWNEENGISFNSSNKENIVVKKAKVIFGAGYYLENVNDYFKVTFKIGTHSKHGTPGTKNLKITYDYSVASLESYHQEHVTKNISANYEVIEY